MQQQPVQEPVPQQEQVPAPVQTNSNARRMNSFCAAAFLVRVQGDEQPLRCFLFLDCC